MRKSESEKSTAREIAKAQGLRFRELLETAGARHRMGLAEFSERAFLLGHYRTSVAATESRLGRLSERTTPPLRTPARLDEWEEAVRMVGVEARDQQRAVEWVVKGGRSCPTVELDAATLAWLPTRAPLKRRRADQERAAARSAPRVAAPRAAVERNDLVQNAATGTGHATGGGHVVTSVAVAQGASRVEIEFSLGRALMALERAAKAHPDDLWIRSALEDLKAALPRQDSNLKRGDQINAKERPIVTIEQLANDRT